MTVFVSTSSVKKKNLKFICRNFKKFNINNIELSGGKYQKNLINVLNEFKDVKFQVHNYFPVPKKSFVLNLASEDNKIIKLSIKHVKKSINLAKKIKRPCYSFHAGYLTDISSSEIGKEISVRRVFDRTKAIKRFVKNVKYLSKFAKKNKVNLLIENNVIDHKEYSKFKTNTALMADPEEIIKIFKLLPNNVRMLLDVAHLKVSSKSLNFPLVKSIKKLNKWVEGYHLSENNGLEDSNQPIKSKSWFWPYIKKNLNYYSIEVYNQKISALVKQKNLTESKLRI